MTFKEHWKKMDWVYYLTLFGVFSVVFFLLSLLFDGRTVGYALRNGLIHGVVFAGLWWLVEALIRANIKR